MSTEAIFTNVPDDEFKVAAARDEAPPPPPQVERPDADLAADLFG